MQINKERSKKMVKLLSLTLASNIALSSGVAKAEVNDDVRSQIEYHNAQHEYEMKVANLSEELYDKAYNDYCNNDSIVINGISYLIKYLHIEYGYLNNQKIVYLKDYHNPKFDIITNTTIDKNYKREKIMDLKYSDVFYAYYCNQDKSLAEYINLFNGGINYNVPETYFYNPIFSNDSKVKIK